MSRLTQRIEVVQQSGPTKQILKGAKRDRIVLPFDSSALRKLIFEAVKDAKDLEESAVRTLETFKKAYEDYGATRIGYVSGVVTSDGPEFMLINTKILARYTDHLAKTSEIPLFAATDVLFNADFAPRLEKRPEPEFYRFWRRILQSGYVTDILMSPRWRISNGAKDELEAAKEVGLRVHYLDDHKDLLAIFAALRP
jgi:hypothetical protein